MASKHEALYNWVSTFLDSHNYLYYEAADAYPNVRMLIPKAGDYLDHTDVCGFKYKSYTFVFLGFEHIDTGTSDVNIRNMELMDEFNTWIEQQSFEGNYPDFGERCSEYELIPLQNMPIVATISEDGLAQYMLGVRIDYREE